MHDNTTIFGDWYNISDVTQLYDGFQRIISNVTLAMPHLGILEAAPDPKNGIVQPQDSSVSYQFNR